MSNYKGIDKYVKGKDQPLRITLNWAKQIEDLGMLENCKAVMMRNCGQSRQNLEKIDREAETEPHWSKSFTWGMNENLYFSTR